MPQLDWIRKVILLLYVLPTFQNFQEKRSIDNFLETSTLLVVQFVFIACFQTALDITLIQSKQIKQSTILDC